VTAEELHILVFTIIDKSGGQGDFSNEEENIIYNRAQYQYQNYLVGEIQQYQYGRPFARIDYSHNQKIRQRLTHSIYNYNLTVTSGVSPFPGDYLLTDALRTTTDQAIRFASQDRLAAFLDDQIDPVATNPCFVIASNGFTIYPDTITSARLTYVRTAPEIRYAVTYNGNNQPIYDPTNSIDPVWSELDCFEIVTRALAIMGVPLQLQQVQAYANNIKVNGQ
jgi:hypothetical protein